MKTFARLFTSSLLPLLLSLPAVALATPSASSPYATDTQSVYVQDATSDGIDNLNMVLCIVHSMRPAAMVNKGPYVALIDMNKCDARSQASTSNSASGGSGATSAPNYITAVANITRVSNSDPMIGKVWMSMTEHGTEIDVYAHLTATQSPSAAPPYGQFRIDYISKLPNGGMGQDGSTPISAGGTGFNGFVDTNGAAVSYLETGPISSETALAMTAASTTAGSGTMQLMDYSTSPATQVTFNFAYDGSETSYTKGVFRRDEGATDTCFNRDMAAAQKSVWNYGTYNANDGSRVDMANPGFPITANDGTNNYYGYASYWGINFQGLDLNVLPDSGSSPVSGVTVQDQRPGNTGTYDLHKVSGRLTKWTVNGTTLSAMDGIPFIAWADLSGQGLGTGPANWEMHWDNTNSVFVVTGQQNCSSNGCVIASVTTTNVSVGAFANIPLDGWSDSFGGNIDIPYTGLAHGGSDTVNYYSQSQVIPGSAGAPTALYCVSDCPTAASLGSFTGSNSPYDSGTDPSVTGLWGMATAEVTYAFGSTGLTESSTSMTVTNSSLLSGQYQNGIMTGRLFDASLTNANCPSGVSGDVCEPSNPSTYYTWQTGADQWNQSLWLTRTSDGTVVSFDAPENISYTVPAGAAYGTWANKNILLQFDGFGNLEGIPGYCVSSTDNSPVDCSVANARYVPAFAIPDGTTMTLATPAGSTPLVIKGLDTEIRLSQIGSCTGVTLAQPTTPAALPQSGALHDPTNSSDVDYIGTEPTPASSVPQVIDGVLQ